MVDYNRESVIEESSSPKKKTKHSFSVIKKSTKAKEIEPKFDMPDSNTPISELDSAPKKGTTKKVVNVKKEVIKRLRAKRRKRRPRVKRKKKRWRLLILMETIINKEVCERKQSWS